MAAPTRPPIPITVIGGYLGAGKTTLLNRLLQEPGGRRLGVIVNDFGSIGIDAELLAAASDTGVVNLPNGCVCCSLGGDLFESLRTLREAAAPPDQIVIEASGVANPAVVAAWGTSAGFEPGGVIVLAAADSIRRQLVDKYVGGEVRRQLTGADLIVLTKTDLSTSAEYDKATSAVHDAADSEIISGGDVPIDVVLGLRPDSVNDDASVARPGHDPRYERWSWSGGVVVKDDAIRLLADLPTGLLRLKGWIDTGDEHLQIQVVGNTAAIPIVATNGPGQVRHGPGSRLEAIALAPNFDGDALTRRFERSAR